MLTAVALLIAAIVFGLIFAGVGALVAGENGAAVGASIAGIFGFLQFLVALVNTLAVILGRGPYFASANTVGRFR